MRKYSWILMLFLFSCSESCPPDPRIEIVEQQLEFKPSMSGRPLNEEPTYAQCGEVIETVLYPNEDLTEASMKQLESNDFGTFSCQFRTYIDPEFLDKLVFFELDQQEVFWSQISKGEKIKVRKVGDRYWELLVNLD